MKRRAALTLPLLAFPVLPAAWAQSGLDPVDISTYPIGQLPPAFGRSLRTGSGKPGDWQIIADPTASRGRAIAQLSADATDYRFPLAVYDPADLRNVEASVRFKAVAGRVDRAAGLAVRLTGADDYYVVRANALEDNVNFYRVVKGRRQEIKGATAKVSSGEWHTLMLRAEGDRFTISFDGKTLFTASDKTFGNAGKVALWTKADSVTHFDQLIIRPLP